MGQSTFGDAWHPGQHVSGREAGGHCRWGDEHELGLGCQRRGTKATHVTWADGLQVLTNHLLYRCPAIADLPPGDGNGLTYARFRTLTSLFSGTSRYTPSQIAERHAAVRFTNPDRPVRTLWYALYDTERCIMNLSFYLRDSDHRQIRTPQLAFSLQPAPAATPSPRAAAG